MRRVRAIRKYYAIRNRYIHGFAINQTSFGESETSSGFLIRFIRHLRRKGFRWGEQSSLSHCCDGNLNARVTALDNQCENLRWPVNEGTSLL